MSSKINIDLQDWMKSKAVKKVFSALDNNARFVGGCVRNHLLGIAITDIDITTPLLPNEVITKLENHNIKAIPTGLDHGTITAVCYDESFEITTLRSDTACDGRHADVEFTNDYEEDAARRDFTVNAMSLSIDGSLYDYFGGQEDLAAGKIIFVGDPDQRVQEDYLRILRFFRFYSYYGRGQFDKAAINACGKFAKNIEGLSGERIQAEVIKLIASNNAVLTLNKMVDNYVAEYVFLQKKIAIKDLEKLITIDKDLEKESDPIAKLSILLNQENYEALAKRWRLSNKDKKRLFAVHDLSKQLNSDVEVAKVQSLLRKSGKDLFETALKGAWAKEIKSPSDIKGRISDKYREIIKFAEAWDLPVFPIKGGDIVAIGLKEGKKIGDALAYAEFLWEESDYKMKELDIISAVKKKFLD